MKTYLLACSFLLVSSSLWCQFGAVAKYQTNTNKNWDKATDVSLFKNTLELGVNYWFRLKNKRVEFLPEVSYLKGSNSNLNTTNFSLSAAERTAIYLNFNTQIYPLDFDGDCNCPTFSKDGDLLKKGFYWLISPGIGYHNVSSTLEGNTLENNGQIKPRIGLGAGLDIGIADILTISPFISYNLDLGPELKDLEKGDNAYFDISENIRSYHIGLRLMFRPDYVKGQGGFKRRR